MFEVNRTSSSVYVHKPNKQFAGRRSAESIEVGIDTTHTIVVEESLDEPREVRVIVRTEGDDAECVWSKLYPEGV